MTQKPDTQPAAAHEWEQKTGDEWLDTALAHWRDLIKMLPESETGVWRPVTWSLGVMAGIDRAIATARSEGAAEARRAAFREAAKLVDAERVAWFNGQERGARDGWEAASKHLVKRLTKLASDIERMGAADAAAEASDAD